MTGPEEKIRAYFSQEGMPAGDRDPIGALVLLLSQGNLDRSAFRSVTGTFGVGRDDWFRKSVLDLVLGFVTHSVEDNKLDLVDSKAIDALKLFADIREGEFLELRPVEVATLLTEQLDRILEDLTIDSTEELEQVELQRAFDLSYDQYLALTRRSFEAAMDTLQHGRHKATIERDRERLTTIERTIRALEPIYRLATAQ